MITFVDNIHAMLYILKLEQCGWNGHFLHLFKYIISSRNEVLIVKYIDNLSFYLKRQVFLLKTLITSINHMVILCKYKVLM